MDDFRDLIKNSEKNKEQQAKSQMESLKQFQEMQNMLKSIKQTTSGKAAAIDEQQIKEKQAEEDFEDELQD